MPRRAGALQRQAHAGVAKPRWFLSVRPQGGFDRREASVLARKTLGGLQTDLSSRGCSPTASRCPASMRRRGRGLRRRRRARLSRARRHVPWWLIFPDGRRPRGGRRDRLTRSGGYPLFLRVIEKREDADEAMDGGSSVRGGGFAVLVPLQATAQDYEKGTQNSSLLCGYFPEFSFAVIESRSPKPRANADGSASTRWATSPT